MRRWGVIGGLAAVVFLVAVGVWTTSPSPAHEKALAAVDDFFVRYVEPDGRVRRPDGDTVSEGQAYAMLMTVAAGQPRRFEQVWRWAQDHLVRPDGAMAWRWEGGAVADQAMAPDADVDAAVALFEAAERFDRPDYARDAGRSARAVLRSAVASGSHGAFLTAGEWTVDDRRPVVNPSYLDPGAFDLLAHQTQDPQWAELARSARGMLGSLTDATLPPDWAVADDGALVPVASPDERHPPARFGLDAARVPIRMAASCETPEGLGVVWEHVAADPGAGVRRLNGAAAAEWDHAAAFVSAAAMATTAAPDDVPRLLDLAERHDHRHPSYYGAAWVALGRLMLTTSTLERCP